MAEQHTIIAHELVEAFNAGDWDRFRAVLSPALIYVETGTGRRAEGIDAYVELCQGWREALPDVRGTTLRVVASGETVAEELMWTGTHTGPLETPSGTIPATGRPIEAPATLWYTVREGKVTAVTHHLDVLTLLGQIGALPGT